MVYCVVVDYICILFIVIVDGAVFGLDGRNYVLCCVFC